MTTQWIALTGTPGTGKTSLARALRRRGVVVVDGRRFALAHDGDVGFDAVRRSRIIDVDRVGRALAKHKVLAPVAFLESHWAHEVPGMRGALVVRCHPRQLERRLARRRWSQAKIRENVEAEAIDLILQECVARFGRRRVGELDATRRAPDALARRVVPVARHGIGRLASFEIGRQDWSAELLRWF